jgi:hypothetical protein
MAVRIVLALVALLVTMPLRAAAQTAPTVDGVPVSVLLTAFVQFSLR